MLQYETSSFVPRLLPAWGRAWVYEASKHPLLDDLQNRPNLQIIQILLISSGENGCILSKFG